MASTLKLFRQGAVGFIEWLGDELELSFRLVLRIFFVFLAFLIRQPLSFDDLAFARLVEFESK